MCGIAGYSGAYSHEDLRAMSSSIRARGPDGEGELFDDTPASMNMWGFTPALFGHLERMWGDFLDQHRDAEKTEFLLPAAVAELMGQGRLAVKAIETDADWIGVTNPADLDPARERLAVLRAG